MRILIETPAQLNEIVDIVEKLTKQIEKKTSNKTPLVITGSLSDYYEFCRFETYSDTSLYKVFKNPHDIDLYYQQELPLTKLKSLIISSLREIRPQYVATNVIFNKNSYGLGFDLYIKNSNIKVISIDIKYRKVKSRRIKAIKNKGRVSINVYLKRLLDRLSGVSSDRVKSNRRKDILSLYKYTLKSIKMKVILDFIVNNSKDTDIGNFKTLCDKNNLKLYKSFYLSNHNAYNELKFVSFNDFFSRILVFIQPFKNFSKISDNLFWDSKIGTWVTR